MNVTEFVEFKMNIQEIEELIQEAQENYLMDIVNSALPDDPQASELGQAVKDLVKPENLAASGTCMQTGAQDFHWENDEWSLELDIPGRVLAPRCMEEAEAWGLV